MIAANTITRALTAWMDLRADLEAIAIPVLRW
jgi:hypothetical protein